MGSDSQRIAARVCRYLRHAVQVTDDARFQEIRVATVTTAAGGRGPSVTDQGPMAGSVTVGR